MAMEERGVKERVNRSQVYVWQDAVQYVNYPLASAYTDSQVGDLVRLNANAELERATSATSVHTYRGVIVGLAPDSGEYPAFGGHYAQPLVAVFAPNKTELIVRQIDNLGNYMQNPTLKVGDTTKFVYNTTTRRWGVQANGADPATGRVVQILDDGRLLIIFGG
jgi:hypothetical protein